MREKGNRTPVLFFIALLMSSAWPHNCVFCTVDSDLQPHARTLSLHSYDESGFYFCTNSSGPKSEQLRPSSLFRLCPHSFQALILKSPWFFLGKRVSAKSGSLETAFPHRVRIQLPCSKNYISKKKDILS